MTLGGIDLNNAQCIEGTFVGDGTSSVALNVGFEPDVVVIESGLDFSQAWQGTGTIVIAKNVFSASLRHATQSSTTATSVINVSFGEQYPYGNPTGSTAYSFYGTYENGVFNVINERSTGATYFVVGNTYSFKAYRKVS